MFEIYIYGVILSCLFIIINYIGYIQDNTINHTHWLFYVNEIFWQLILIGPLSWVGVIFSTVSIINRYNNRFNGK